MREVAEAFASSKGRYGYRRVRAVLRTRVSEKALRRIMAEDGPTAHVPERRGYGSCEGEATPAPGSLADRDFTAEMPNEKWPADITRDQGRGREGRASRRRSAATMAGSSHTRPVPVPTPGSPTGCSSRPWKRCRRERGPWCIPTADAAAGSPDGWRSWTATARRGRRAPKAVPRTTPPRRGSSDV
uniref:IS3 family transposase n=1 Tax=Bifidobacterium adolescentis TaxID=1680 RepID=UPI004024E046